MSVEGVIVALTFKDGKAAFAEQTTWAPWTAEDRLFMVQWLTALQKDAHAGRLLAIERYGPEPPP